MTQPLSLFSHPTVETNETENQKNLIPSFVTSLVIALAPLHVQANEDGLYGAAVPSDAAFVRWLNANETTAPAFGFVPSQFEIDTYAAISPDLLDVAQPGSYHSIVTAPNRTEHTIKDPDLVTV